MGAAILDDYVHPMIYGHYWIRHPTGGWSKHDTGMLLPLAIQATDKVRQKAHSFL